MKKYPNFLFIADTSYLIKEIRKKLALFLISLLIICLIYACVSKNSNDSIVKTENIKKELTQINRLLRDTAFAKKMATGQDENYALNNGLKKTTFLNETDSILKKRYREEKIAINLAGFYAVECGVGALIDQGGETPVYWLSEIVHNTLDSNEVLLLNRFANATWKTGQPFRGLSRISRDNFIVANFLNTEEIQKDADQLMAAASFLLDSLKTVSDESKQVQVEKISKLLKDKNYAFEMARHIEAAYYVGQHKPVPLFVTAKEDAMIIQKSANEEKIATNTAGFYALECGVSYLSAKQNKLPSDILKSIINDSINERDKLLLERFANATWKASQPFRSLDRITRDIFMPFDLLPKEEVKKDWDQIQAAAVMVLKSL